MLRWSLCGSLVLVLAVFAWRGVYRTRPLLTFYVVLYAVTRFPPPRPHDPAWVRAVWVPMTSALLVGRLLILIESLIVTTRPLRERWYVLWGSLVLGAACFAGMHTAMPDASMIGHRQFLQIGMALAMLLGTVYAVLRAVRPWRELPVLALLLHYAAFAMIDPYTGLLAPIFLIQQESRRGFQRLATWTIVGILLSLALAHCLPPKPKSGVEKR